MLDKLDFSHFNVSKATLFNVNLSFANLSSSYFENSNLSSAYFTAADLSHTKFTDANLSNADLSYAILSKAILTRANLSNAEIYNSIIIGCKAYDGLPRRTVGSTHTRATLSDLRTLNVFTADKFANTIIGRTAIELDADIVTLLSKHVIGKNKEIIFRLHSCSIFLVTQCLKFSNYLRQSKLHPLYLWGFQYTSLPPSTLQK